MKMRSHHLTAGLAISVVLGILAASSATQAAERYHIVDRIQGPPTQLWDYAFIKVSAQRLYLATSQGIMTLDLRTKRASAQFVPAGRTHGVLPVDETTAALADATDNSVKLFDADTGRIIAAIPTGKSPVADGWHNPDALVLEPKTGLLVAANGDTGALALIDLTKRAVVDTIPVGGKLEFADADGDGSLYINARTRKTVAVVDVLHRKVLREIQLKDCAKSSGLAFDRADRLIISVCENGSARFIDAASGREVASLPVGKGADAVLYDPVRRVAFVPAGEDGTLSVIAIRGPRDMAVTQVLKTQLSARLGAIDSSTGRLYLPIVEYDLTAPPVKMQGLEFPQPRPETFGFLVVGTE
jgi:DNA-binding beta-propeller fold protein YncE